MARRRRSGGRGRSGMSLGSGDLIARRDMIVAGGYVNNSGAQVATSSWNGADLTLTAGTQAAYQAVVLPEAVTAVNAAPGIGECQVDDIEGSLFLSAPTNTGVYTFGWGIYISKYDSRTGTWGIRYPSSTSSDAARDDWLMLRALTITLPANGFSDSMLLEIKLALPHPVVLGGGEALHVCVDNNADSSGNINVNPYFRSRIADVT